jgi:alpha-mannosidase
MYPEIFRVGEEAAGRALERIARNVDTRGEGRPVLVFNTLPWDRSAVVSVDVPGDAPCAVVGPDGEEVPVQRSGERLLFVASAPSAGYAVYRLVPRQPSGFRSPLKASRTVLENRWFRVRLDSKGAIVSLVHRPTGRELVRPGERANLLRLYEDKPIDWPAWDIDFFYEDKWEDVTQTDSLELVEEGPVRAVVEVRRSFSRSRLSQRIVIYADSPRIDFETWVDWHEKDRVLKALFPVDVNASEARYEIQFGTVTRPTHTNTSWDFARFEVCAHRWADISEEGFGMSLMNDCKYGHHTKGSEMRLTLLRAPKEPDPEADMGEHVFTYSIMPHAGDYIEAGTVREAYGLNVPMRVLPVEASEGPLPPVRSFLRVDSEHVILETVKKAEREETVILRCYECHNRRGTVTVTVDLPFSRVYECDLMEDNLEEVPCAGSSFTFPIRPFEIKTFKLVR